METMTLNAVVRDDAGKGVARRLRRADRLPAVLNRKGSTLALAIDKRPMLKLINSQKGLHTLLTLKLEKAPSDPERRAIISEYQVHPVSGELLHVDFREIREDEKIIITVPVRLLGVPEGVRSGGVMERATRSVRVECLPADVIDAVTLDVTDLETGQIIHASALELPDGVVLASRPEAVLVSVTTPRAAVEEEGAEGAEEAEAEPAEGGEAAPAEGSADDAS